jgi:hypothetical protein
VFHGAETELWANFIKAAAFKNSGEKGTFREDGVAKFLREQLPGRYGVVKGELIDSSGRRSGQVDIIVFDQTRAAPFVRGSKHAQWILPVEAALATIEVKSRLTRDELVSIGKGIRLIHSLRPWGQPFAVISGYREGQRDAEVPRIQTTVFAFESNLAPDDWARKEITRAREALSESDALSAQLDRIVVLNRGMINVGKGNALLVGDKGILADWYFTVLNYLEREVQRRFAIPFDDYQSRSPESWRRIVDDDFPGSRERREQARRVERVAPRLKKHLQGHD